MPKRKSIQIEGMIHSNSGATATQIGPLLISGLLRGKDPVTDKLPDDKAQQAEFLMQHISELMAGAGGSLDDIVKVRIWVRSRGDREFLDPVWERTFPEEDNRPSRHVQELSLGNKAAYFEAEVVAYIE